MPRPLQPRKIPQSFFQPREDTAIAWLGMSHAIGTGRIRLCLRTVKVAMW
jgi:hypothetical protein